MAAEKEAAGITAAQAQELADLEIRMKRVQLRRAEREVDLLEATQDQIDRRHQEQQTALRETYLKEREVQRACPHRKGGKDDVQLQRGSDNERSIFWNTYPWSPHPAGACQRCGREWWHPDANPAKVAERAYYEDSTLKEAAKAMLAEYMIAIELPTDNVAGGSQLFHISYPAGKAASNGKG